MVPSTGADEFIPRFRIHGVSFAQRRHLEETFAVPLQWDSEGTPLVGDGGGLLAMPSIDDQIVDLQSFAGWHERYIVLREGYERYGQRLVLMGRAEQAIKTERGFRCFSEIGIPVPVRLGGRAEMRQPSYLLGADDVAPAPGSLCPLRIVEATFDGDNLRVFACESVSPRSGRVRIVRGHLHGVQQSYEPRDGDAVLVKKSRADEYCVAGFPLFSVSWARDESDALRLYDPEQRRLVLRQLLPSSEDSLWATVETVDTDRRLIVVSRRRQIARSLPEPERVVLARVMGALSSSRLLVDLGGLAWTMGLDELSYGSPSLKELCAYHEHEGGLRGASLEVVRTLDGKLSALAVYDELPNRGELEAIIVACTSSGILVMAQGRRIFVSKGELAWCELSPDQISRLFIRGQRILVSVACDELPRFSHIRTQAIRTEFASLLRKTSEPIYVRCVDVGEGRRRAIVRGRSTVLMELILDLGEVVEDRICAYVRRIDSRRHRVELSLDETPPKLWNLPQVVKVERQDSPTVCAVDILSTEVIKSSLEDLRGAIPGGGAAAVSAWAARQWHLEPSPRNLRMTLEELHLSFEGSAKWVTANGSLDGPAADDEKKSAFEVIWSQVTGVLAGRVVVPEVSPLARFAVGYFCLLEGRARDAEWHLQVAWVDNSLQNHFEVGLSLARATFFAHGGDRTRATHLLRSLTQRFIAGALATISPPIFEPDLLESAESDRATFARAMAAGDLNALEKLLIGKFGARNPSAARTRSNAVWFLLAKARLGPEFDRAVDAFFDALRDEESIGLQVDPRLHVMAALLSFARGNFVEAWWRLGRLRQVVVPELRVACFWRAILFDEAWSSDEPSAGALDRLLVSLWHTWRQCRWREEVDRRAFDALWDALRAAPVRWVLDSRICHSLPEPPTSRDELVQWATEYGAEAALRPLLAENSLGESGGE